jgi:RND family efflux transporter MFP subunit
VSNPLQQLVTDYVDFTGSTEGSNLVEVRSRVSGEIIEIGKDFRPGGMIKKDTLLFKIDPLPFELAVKRATAEVKRLESEVLRFENATKRLEAEAQRAKVNFDKGSISEEAYAKAFYDFQESRAASEAAKAARDGAKVVLERAELDLKWTDIVAKSDGIISVERIKPGNLVQADLTLLTTILQIDPIYIYYDIDETTVKRILELIKQGSFKSARENRIPIKVSLGALNDFPFRGVVNFVDNQIDRTTGTMRVRAEVPNPLLENRSVAISAGMFTRVRLNMGKPYTATLVSERAVLSILQDRYLMIVNDQNQVEQLPVKILRKYGRLVEVAAVSEVDAAKLTTKTKVITNGIVAARPGMTVNPQPGAMPGAEDAAAFAPDPEQPQTSTLSQAQ